MTEKTSCPSCGAEWAGAEWDLGKDPSSGRTVTVCPSCGKVAGKDSGTDAGPHESAGVAEEGDSVSAGRSSTGSGTVGDFATVTGHWTEGTLNWQEGLLVADRFRIVRFIGQGGMGKVFLAQDETLGRLIALKCVPQEIIFDGDARDDLREEANHLLDLAHDNIVRIHTYYDGPTWPFFAMEYLQGPTLKKLLRSRKHYGRKFSVAEVIHIARQVACGLSYAHSKGVVHRDLKPGNLMLAEDSDEEELTDSSLVKITDFGVSRVIAESTLRQTGRRSGTLPYMSPEQFLGEPCTVRSDIYSFACTFYELLSGKPPFYTGDIGYQILNKAPARLADVPGHIQGAIARGLSKDPRNRFDSVDEFLGTLEGKQSASAPQKRKGAMALLLVAVAAFLIFALGIALNDPRQDDGASEISLSNGPPGPVLSGLDQREENKFRELLEAALLEQLPYDIGKNSAAVDQAAVDDPGESVSLRFVFPGPMTQMSSKFQLDLLSRLILDFHSERSEGRKGLREGSLVEGQKTFVLDALPEGRYSLKAYLSTPNGGEAPSPKLFMDDPHQFRVDLTPPSFEVAPVSPERFLDTTAQEWITFEEAVDLEVVSWQEEITEVWYKEKGSNDKLQMLQEPSLWEIDRLLPGVVTTYNVSVVDAAGNMSAAVEISIRRRTLDVPTFELPDGVVGNLASVAGILRVEGGDIPSLKYFVNERPVEPEEEGSPRINGENIAFAAKIRLPKANNKIEVRYAWRDNDAQSFPRPMTLNDVKVRAPELHLEELAGRTRDASIRVEGRVEPYFKGVDVRIENKGQGAKSLKLRVAPGGAMATFSQEVALVDGENPLTFKTFYGSASLGVSPSGPTVFSDQQPPRLVEPPRFVRAGTYLYMTLQPSEDLSLVRVRESVGKSESGVWQAVERNPETRAYTFDTTIPMRSVTFWVELTDIAGNTGTASEFYPVRRDEVADSGFAPTSLQGEGTLVPASEGDPGEGHSTVLAEGVTLISSRFVEEMGMEFVPFGQERLELSRYEVCERAWFQFLRETGHGDFGVGRINSPMVLQSFSPDLLREFVKWFEHHSADGYTYAIPTVDHWFMAFAGANDVEVARGGLEEWFQGADDARHHFNPEPTVRYGLNKVTRLGSRHENRTPTGLLDMESNVQELVLEGEIFMAIGASNRDTGTEIMLDRCLQPRRYDTDAQTHQGRLTGVRLLRKPEEAR